MKEQAPRLACPACPAQLHLLDNLSQSASVFQLPAVAIVSRDVAVVYSMQLDLAEPHSSLVIEPGPQSPAHGRRAARIGRLEPISLLRGSDTHELR